MFIDRGGKGLVAAPAERNVFLASRTRKNISLRWSWNNIFGPTFYKHSIPTGLVAIN
ncbi:MAG: hypothetical protein ND895_11220 [Pyrinomonadaceae bacterium]|nr:hypothetical protein [Pyrinomonadaceae bacterium]